MEPARCLDSLGPALARGVQRQALTMRLATLGLVMLLPTLANATTPAGAPGAPVPGAGPVAPRGPAPGRMPMYGAQSYSEERPRLTPAQGATMKALRKGWKTPKQAEALAPTNAQAIGWNSHMRSPLRRTGPGTMTLKVLDREELSKEQVDAADFMEDELDDTQAMTAFPVNRAQRLTLRRKADIRAMAERPTPDTYTQLGISGYTGGELELDLMMPNSGHDRHDGSGKVNPIDYRGNAREDEFVLTMQRPDGTHEQIGPFPGNSYGNHGELQRGAYVTTARIKLPELHIGETKFYMTPAFTQVGGFANGRTLGIIRDN